MRIVACLVPCALWTGAFAQVRGLPEVSEYLDPATSGLPEGYVASGGCVDGVGPCCQPCNFFTGFEPAEGFTANAWIGDGNQGAVNGPFYTWDASCGGFPEPSCPAPGTAAHVSTVHPFAGTQHLRISQDTGSPTALFGTIVDARVPASNVAASNAPPLGPVTVSFQFAGNAAFGPNFMVQPNIVSQGMRTATWLFFYYGTMYVIDRAPGHTTFVEFGFWDTTGAYDKYSMAIDPCIPFMCIGGANDTMSCDSDLECPGGTCRGRIQYLVNDQVIYEGAVWAGEGVDQLLFFTDTMFDGGQEHPGFDIDDIEIIRDPNPCPAICGDGNLVPGEECDGPFDDACPGRCVSPGGTGTLGEPECTCDVSACTVSWDLPNGGPQMYDDHFGWWTFTADAPAYAIETCGTGGYDSALSVWEGTCDNLTLVARNDDCSNYPGFGDNSDPLASCYDPVNFAGPYYNACLCFPTTIGRQYWVFDEGVAFGDETVITVTKRLACGDNSDFGACCDPFIGCVDVQSSGECLFSGVFHDRKTCEGLGSVCPPPSRGACCERLTGSCAETTESICLGNRTFTLGLRCTPGVCQPDVGTCCVQTAFDASCSVTKDVDCAGFFTPGSDCDAVECGPEAIPTVSAWGLLVLTLAFLVGAKVAFGRKRCRERARPPGFARFLK